MIDRIAPTRRPTRAPGGYQQWRSLLFTHWAVPVESLRPRVPMALELDLHEGIAYVGVVPFAMRGVRPWWCPKLLGFNFLETNVRTYVLYGDQPGVYFFSLDAASALAVQIANRFWGLPYYHADMSCEFDGDVIRHQTVRRASRAQHRVRYRRGEPLGPSEPGSIEFFLLERYLLFVERHRKIYVGHVHHKPYPVQRAELLEVQDELMTAAGLRCPVDPAFVHYSEGVDVEIFDLRAAGDS